MGGRCSGSRAWLKCAKGRRGPVGEAAAAGAQGQWQSGGQRCRRGARRSGRGEVRGAEGPRHGAGGRPLSCDAL